MNYITLLSGNPVICYLLFHHFTKKSTNMYYSNFGIFEKNHFQWLIQKIITIYEENDL